MNQARFHCNTKLFKDTRSEATEAMAITLASFQDGPGKVMQFDRPFLIYDALNKVVIFWARVVEPTPIRSGTMILDFFVNKLYLIKS